MAQQQLLLLALCAIIIGTAIVIGVQIFSESAIAANKKAVIQDCVTLAIRAHEWYRKPVFLGGGGHSFNGISLAKINFSASNENGTFAIITGDSGASANITATGIEPDLSNPLTVTITVFPASIGIPTITIP